MGGGKFCEILLKQFLVIFKMPSILLQVPGQ